jgi:hypothetical protein
MSAIKTSSNNPDEDALFDFGDLIAGGGTPTPRDELEETVLRVQQALGGSDLFAMPQSVKTTVWEDIMHATKSASALAPLNPWDALPGEDSPATPSRSRYSASAPHSRAMWTIAANVTLAIIIALPGFAAWKGLGGFGPSGGGESTAIPAVALQAATPEASQEPAVVASPDAVRETVTDCNLSGDIPIIPQLTEDQSPLTTTSLYLTRNDRTSIEDRQGTLTIGCEGEERVVLAENVTSAGPGPWPGTVSVQILPPDTDDLTQGHGAFVDIASGEMIDSINGNYSYSKQGYLRHEGGNPWIIGPSADDPATTLIADLRTMEIRPFSEAAGVRITENSTIIVSTPADDGTIAIGSLPTNDGPLPGDFLLLGDSFDNVRWISVPDTVQGISGISLSPDGEHAAVLSMGADGMTAMSYRYSLISTADGAEIAVSEEIQRTSDPFVAWVRDGSAVAYLAGSNLQKLAVDGSGVPETVFEAPAQLSTLQTTWDPNVVVARTRGDIGPDGQPVQSAQDVVYSINVETGEVHEFPGMDVSSSISWITDAGALVMFEWLDEPSETVTYTVFDPVSGEQIGDIVDAPTTQVAPRTLPTIGRRSIAVSQDGTVEVIAIGTQHLYAFITGSDGLTMQRVESPAGLLSEMFLTASVFLSPDGSMLSLSGEEDEGRTRYLISLDDPNAEWVEIPATVVDSELGYVTFVEGIGS